MDDVSLKLFAGSSHRELALEIAHHLMEPLSKIEIKRFASNEIYVRPIETVRGGDAFVIQTCTANVNEDLMELFIILDALKRSFAKRVHVIIPYYGYSRQDRVAQPREPISAKLIANLISAAGADHLVTLMLHSDQEQGFFDIPVDNLGVEKLFAEYFLKKGIKKPMVVSPDAGGAKKAKRFADLIGADLAILHKVRETHNVSAVMHVVGNVKGRTCILYDDIIDTAGSVCNGKEALIQAGANKDVYIAAAHPVFSDPAIID